jgi:hypothetical protein
MLFGIDKIMTFQEAKRRHDEMCSMKVVIGHDDDPDCDCPPCYEQRELYFWLKHWWDDETSEERECRVAAGVKCWDE